MRLYHNVKFKKSLTRIIQEKLVIISSLFISFLFYGIYLNTHFSTDSYSYMISHNVINHHLELGRFVPALGLYLMQNFQIEPIQSQFIFTFINIIVFSILSIFTYLKFTNRNCENESERKIGMLKKNLLIYKLLIYLGVLTIFFNAYFIDWFVWAESSIFFSIAITLAVLAGFEVVHNKRSRLRNYFISTIILIFALGTNQAMGTYFFIICLTIIYLDFIQENQIKKTIFDILLTGFVYATSAMSQIILLLIFRPARQDFSKVDIFVNLKKIIAFIPDIILRSYTFLPRYFYASATLVLIISFLAFLVFLTKGRRIILFLISFVIMCIINIAIFAPHIISSDLWITPRTVVGIMGWPGILTIWIAFLIQLDNGNWLHIKKLLYPIVCSIVVVFLFTNYFYTQKIALGTQITNHMDRELTNIIYTKIQTYETRSGIVVNNLSFINDGSISWAYNDLISSSDTNVREFAVGWGRTPMFNLYTGRNFKEIPMVKDINDKYFIGKSWTSYSEDQIVIIGDTAYIAVY